MVDGTLPQDSPHKWQLFNNGRLDGLLAEERAAGVDRLVLLPVATSPAKVRPLNLAAGEAARKHPEVIAFAALHPDSDWPRDLAEAIDLGLKGVKLHPLQQQFSLTAPETRRMLAAVAEAGLPRHLRHPSRARPCWRPNLIWSTSSNPTGPLPPTRTKSPRRPRPCPA